MFDSHSKPRTTDPATDTKLVNPVVACERERKYNVSVMVNGNGNEMAARWNGNGNEMTARWKWK